MPDSSKKDTSKDRIYQELRRSIVLGKLKPGEKLNLDQLAEDYQTSVTPVREALQMLTQEELVSSKAHSGYFITRMTLKELKDLFKLREILELAAVELAAPIITDIQLEELESVHPEISDQEDQNYERAVIENRKFHYLIALASGNQELADLVGRIHDKLSRFFVFVHPPEEVKGRHQLLINALRTHDVILARHTMLEEITETREITLSRLIENEGATWYLEGTKTDLESG
jgi:DNA-binding GntR family transcriptional regulator